MGNEKEGFIRRLLRRRRKEKMIVMDGEEFERLFEAEPAAEPGQGDLRFETVWAALLDTGEYLKTVAGTIRETNRKIESILGGLKQDLEEYWEAETRRSSEGAAETKERRKENDEREGKGPQNGDDSNTGH
jgi:hypothetical protein